MLVITYDHRKDNLFYDHLYNSIKMRQAMKQMTKGIEKAWGKGGDNLARVIDKTVHGEELDPHQKKTMHDVREGEAQCQQEHPHIGQADQEFRAATGEADHPPAEQS